MVKSSLIQRLLAAGFVVTAVCLFAFRLPVEKATARAVHDSYVGPASM